MNLEIVGLPDTCTMFAVPVGSVCRRIVDGLYFLKTTDTSRNQDGETTHVCVELSTCKVHHIKSSTKVEIAPSYKIVIDWRKDGN